jgi:signal transduction histidine kinase
MEIAVQLCQSMMDTIRSLAHMLHPPVLENLGLNTALSSFCREFGRHAHLSIRYEGQEIPTLPEAVEIGLYRILQEALNNVARHAGTNSVQVQLQHDANVISLTVKDDGLGFDVGRMINTTLHTEGIGLSGMQERIESVGGRLIIESAPGQGSTIIVWIPL